MGLTTQTDVEQKQKHTFGGVTVCGADRSKAPATAGEPGAHQASGILVGCAEKCAEGNLEVAVDHECRVLECKGGVGELDAVGGLGQDKGVVVEVSVEGRGGKGVEEAEESVERAGRDRAHGTSVRPRCWY